LASFFPFPFIFSPLGFSHPTKWGLAANGAFFSSLQCRSRHRQRKRNGGWWKGEDGGGGGEDGHSAVSFVWLISTLTPHPSPESAFPLWPNVNVKIRYSPVPHGAVDVPIKRNGMEWMNERRRKETAQKSGPLTHP
jgi:hypothetical protein